MLLSAGLSNPSALTRIQGFAAATEMEATWLIKEAGLFSGLIVQSFDRTAIGMLILHNGSSSHRQSTISLLLSRSLGTVQLGSEFLFHHSTATGYPSSVKVDGGIYCRLELSPVFQVGFRIRNISGFLTKQENNYAPIVHAGVGYDVSPVIQIGCEWVQEHASSPLVTSGLLYRFHRLFVMIAGMNLTPCQPFGGFQLNQQKWNLLVKTSFHPVLGWSPSIGISFGVMKPGDK